MYKAVVEFYDLTDGERKYRVGDVYPRPGFSASAERIAELSGSNNKLGKPVIAAESKGEPKAEPKEKPEETAEPKEEQEITRKEVNSMPYFKVKSVAIANGIEVGNKKTAELRAEVIEKLGL